MGKNRRGIWNEDNLKRAVNAVLQSNMSKKCAARQYGIPRSTLIRHIQSAEAGLGVAKHLGRSTVLNEDQEAELVTTILDMERRLFGLTPTDVKKLVFQYCEKLDIKHPFDASDKSAGRYWLKGFLSRHPELSIRKPEAVSIQRAAGFNLVKANIFYDLIEKTIFNNKGERQIPAANIFNVDETGFSIVQETSKIIAGKGKKYVGTLTSAEKGRTVTAVCCMSAAGMYVPPMLIFPRMRMKNCLMDHCAPGMIGTCTKSGWIDEKTFTEWFKHFISSVTPQAKDAPVLLILDGHASHTRNLEVIEMARENNTILLCLPSHTSHRLQPLDVSFFRSLKAKYSEEVRIWLRNHPGRKLCEDQIAELFSRAYGNAACLKNATNGFRKTGKHFNF